MTKTPPTITVISTEAKRSGEISSSDGTGGITVGDLSTQSIIKAFSICPIPTRSPARDDGGGGQHWTHIRCEGSEGSEDAPRGRKGAQLRRGLYRRVVFASAQGQRPFGPRVVVAPFGRRLQKSQPAPIPVISTAAKRSGEISSSDGTGGITVGDLSTQSIMGAVLVCLP